MDTGTRNKLLSLIGHRLEYRGQLCSIVDVLVAENALVLRVEDSATQIQGNQFGEANRRVAEHHTVCVIDETGRLNPAIEALLA